MKSINYNAPVKCSKSININASASKVWSVLTNINQWPAWQKKISNSKIDGELQSETTFTWKTGGATIHSTLHTVNANSEFGWTGKTFGMYAIHNWLLIDNDGNTTVEVQESMEGLLARLFKTSFNKNLAEGMQYWLECLKQTCEN